MQLKTQPVLKEILNNIMINSQLLKQKVFLLYAGVYRFWKIRKGLKFS